MEDSQNSHWLKRIQSQPTSTLAKEILILFLNPWDSILHPVFKFYLCFIQRFVLLIFIVVVPCPGIGFPRKPIHLDICGTDRAHHQLAEMMEIKTMQSIQINGAMTMSSWQEQTKGLYKVMMTIAMLKYFYRLKIGNKKIHYLLRDLLITSLPKENWEFWRQIVSHNSFI